MTKYIQQLFKLILKIVSKYQKQNLFPNFTSKKDFHFFFLLQKKNYKNCFTKKLIVLTKKSVVKKKNFPT